MRMPLLLLRFVRDQFVLAWRIGRQDFDGAILVLEASLSRMPDDAETKNMRTEGIAMIAELHEGAHRHDEAIAAAKRAHALDSRHLETNKLLSKIYAKRGEHDLAAKHVRLALESPPLMTQGPQWMWHLLGWITSISPRLRQFTTELEQSTRGQGSDDVAWHGWAVKYLAWCDAQRGVGEKQTVH